MGKFSSQLSWVFSKQIGHFKLILFIASLRYSNGTQLLEHRFGISFLWARFPSFQLLNQLNLLLEIKLRYYRGKNDDSVILRYFGVQSRETIMSNWHKINFNWEVNEHVNHDLEDLLNALKKRTVEALYTWYTTA